MPQIVTMVTATVDVAREAELAAGYRELTSRPTPDGLLRTELLRGASGSWRIATLWRDRAALDAILESPGPPPAAAPFRKVGADPSLEVFTVEHAHNLQTSGT